MRNPLKRRVPTGTTKPSLRFRLAGAKTKLVAAKEKYGRTLRVHRALNAPLPIPEPAVDRVALVNYATFLALERDRLCAELYPHMGVKGTQFVLSMNEAWSFCHGTDNSLSNRKGLPPASSRAVKVLNLLGIDWRKDATESDRDRYDDSSRADTGERPAVPYGFPALDAELTQALDDLTRLDAAIEALHEGNPDRDGYTVPGYAALNEARSAALGRLAKTRARGLPGLQAKAHALLTDGIAGYFTGPFGEISESLARDLIGAGRTWLDHHRPDPIFAAIEETKRLAAVVAATLHEWPHDTSEPNELTERRGEATDAFWDHARETLFKTVPSSPEGCRALARYATAFMAEQGTDEDLPAVLDLIGRSPLRA